MTTGMLRFVESDDEIALILGHEIAHHILGHPYSRPLYEADSDYMGCYLAARGGLRVPGGAAVVEWFHESSRSALTRINGRTLERLNAL